VRVLFLPSFYTKSGSRDLVTRTVRTSPSPFLPILTTLILTTAVVCLRVSLGILGHSAHLLIFFLSQPELIYNMRGTSTNIVVVSVDERLELITVFPLPAVQREDATKPPLLAPIRNLSDYRFRGRQYGRTSR
jgi:hypothetical protein